MASLSDLDLKTRRWTRAEYDRLVDLGWFHDEKLELLDGLLVVGDRQTPAHAAVTGQAAHLLHAVIGAGWHERQHAPIALDAQSEPEPDVSVVARVTDDY